MEVGIFELLPAEGFMGKWVLEWSSCDPQLCWSELWNLWRFEGVRDQLFYIHSDTEMVGHRGESRELPGARATWSQSRDHARNDQKPTTSLTSRVEHATAPEGEKID